jgi:hypothetical protein
VCRRRRTDAVEAAFSLYLRTSYDFLREESRGSPESIRRAAGAVQVYRDGQIMTVAALYDEISTAIANQIHTYSCVAEAALADEARRVFQLAAELDETAARALLTYADLLDADLGEFEAEAAEAWDEAAEALYGPEWY